MTREDKRLDEARARQVHWRRWGPYLSERAWGTVREDYSPHGTAWGYLPHDHARSHAYRWNEDGLAGFCDRHQRICLAVTLWNGRDPILKERLFGLTGDEGNHGEDVKEYYYYLDSTPTHSYVKFLYKYPQAPFPYELLVEANRSRDRAEPEFELIDTSVFDDHRYFDVIVEYAKEDAEDFSLRITAINRGPDPAVLHVLPTVWFRNTWAWRPESRRPELSDQSGAGDVSIVALEEPAYGRRWLYCRSALEVLYTENETNVERLYGVAGQGRCFKDGIHEAVIRGRREAVNQQKVGTKAAAWYQSEIPAGGGASHVLRFSDKPPHVVEPTFTTARTTQLFDERRREADEFYLARLAGGTSEDSRRIARQALSSLLLSKQFYHYVVNDWLDGDPAQPVPPSQRLTGRNHQWRHLYNADVISMPDKWEYPWYASWDLAFQCVAMSLVDPDYAKDQLLLFLREWYLHPNGQLPAYEWALSDVNPPVHAWAVWRVYKIEQRRRGTGDRSFLQRAFHKLLLNFTWWANRKDPDGKNLFQGGFLGLDNIGVFDRSAPLPAGGYIEQSDGTSWMAMFALNMFAIAVELARHDPSYEDVASKFWEHFLHIAYAMNHRARHGCELWDEEEGFYYDVLLLPDGTSQRIKVRSIVGLSAIFAVETLEPEVLERMHGFRRRMEWFIENRPDLTREIAALDVPGRGRRRLLSLVNPHRLRRLLELMLDENEFLSPFGIRALSRRHAQAPYRVRLNGIEHCVAYEPGESTSGMFGGNSNWRGPIWFPVNFLLIESLQRFHHYLGDEFRVEFPSRSGHSMHLGDVASELSRRLTSIFRRADDGRRPLYGDCRLFQEDPHWRDLILFHEFFHGDTGLGLGASHQTGWTALVAKLIQQSGA